MLGLNCCSGFSLPAESSGYSPVVHSLLLAVASLAAEQACVLEHRLRSCGTQAWLLLGLWDLPDPIEHMSPALAGGVCTTEPSGKPNFSNF